MKAKNKELKPDMKCKSLQPAATRDFNSQHFLNQSILSLHQIATKTNYSSGAGITHEIFQDTGEAFVVLSHTRRHTKHAKHNITRIERRLRIV